MMGRQPRRGPEEQLHLPPGFRFYPSDEELVVHYLCRKAAAQPFAVAIIGEVDLYKFDPWDLPEKALFGEKEWYFFSPRDRKYPNGSRPNRAAGSGYWKATGTDKPITTLGGRQKVGVKKALVFYTGKAPKGVKTNWIMHEYRLADSGTKAARRKGSLRLDDWVLCRIYKKASSAGVQRWGSMKENGESTSVDEVLTSLPEIEDTKLMNLPRINSLRATTMTPTTTTLTTDQSMLNGFKWMNSSGNHDLEQNTRNYLQYAGLQNLSPAMQNPVSRTSFGSNNLSHTHEQQQQEAIMRAQNWQQQPWKFQQQKQADTSDFLKQLQGFIRKNDGSNLNVNNYRHESPETHDSPVNSSVDEEKLEGMITQQPAEILQQSSKVMEGDTNRLLSIPHVDSFQLFNLDALASPSGRPYEYPFSSLADNNLFSLNNPNGDYVHM